MALVEQGLGRAVVTPEAFAAPTVSETITAPGNGVFLWLKIGATATDVTLTRYGDTPSGDARADYVESALSNTERVIPVISDFRDPDTGNALLTLSQVANVTALLIRTGG